MLWHFCIGPNDEVESWCHLLDQCSLITKRAPVGANTCFSIKRWFLSCVCLFGSQVWLSQIWVSPIRTFVTLTTILDWIFLGPSIWQIYLYEPWPCLQHCNALQWQNASTIPLFTKFPSFRVALSEYSSKMIGLQRKRARNSCQKHPKVSGPETADKSLKLQSTSWTTDGSSNSSLGAWNSSEGILAELKHFPSAWNSLKQLQQL